MFVNSLKSLQYIGMAVLQDILLKRKDTWCIVDAVFPDQMFQLLSSFMYHARVSMYLCTVYIFGHPYILRQYSYTL